MGSKALYDWIDHNPSLAAFPVSYTNDPYVMARNAHLVSINACVEVDLYGQISSESLGIRQISGTGGQLDYATGAYLSKGGISFICCGSTHKDKQGNTKSTIVPTLSRLHRHRASEPGTQDRDRVRHCRPCRTLYMAEG